jgi:equilibrative nucleoside transporter 1/2/3
MLWSWNMFLAAGPYFARRFASNPKLLTNFQPAELFVSTFLNLGSMLLLTKLQRNASYPLRILSALLIYMATFTLLAISTRTKVWHMSAEAYFALFIFTVAASSLATGLCQNGVFAFVAGFGREEYTQAIMTGQAVAGVLPCIAQIVSVLSVPPKQAEGGEGGDASTPQESSTSAFSYFLTATGVSALTLVAFLYLLARQNGSLRARKFTATTQTATTAGDGIGNSDSTNEVAEDPSTAPAKSIPLLRLLVKLFWLAGAVFLTFAITMVFPVFTQVIHSTHPVKDRPRILEPASFVPLAFLVWNSGDLLGRLITAIPALSLTHRPRLVFGLAACRIVFIPLYLLCNIPSSGGDRSAKVQSDFFYLGVVQLLFGLSSGFVGSTCMMGAIEWVGVEEREAAGGFMGLCLVAGLTVGSLCSFAVSTAWT